MLKQYSRILLLTLVFFSCDNKVVEEDTGIRIGVPPSPYSLPFIVAKKEGYFEREGLLVDVVQYPDTCTKDQSFNDGVVGIMISDLTTAIITESQLNNLKIITLVRGGGPRHGRTAILVGPNTSITELAELKGHSLAVLKNSITEFAGDQMLKSHGISPKSIHKRFVNDYGEALQLLLKNRVSATILTTPLVSFAELQGCRVLIDDYNENLCYLVLLARKDLIEKNPDTIKKILKVYNEVVRAINQNPNAFRPYLLDIASKPSDDPESIRAAILTMTHTPKRLKNSIPVPEYPYNAVPKPSQVHAVQDWLLEKNIISKRLNYDDLVTQEFLLSSPDRELLAPEERPGEEFLDR